MVVQAWACDHHMTSACRARHAHASTVAADCSAAGCALSSLPTQERRHTAGQGWDGRGLVGEMSGLTVKRATKGCPLTALRSFSMRLAANCGINAISTSASSTCSAGTGHGFRRRRLRPPQAGHTQAPRNETAPRHAAHAAQRPPQPLPHGPSSDPSTATHLGQHGRVGGRVGERRVHVEDGVVEVGVRVGARARAQQVLPPLGAQERHVLHQVRHALRLVIGGWSLAVGGRGLIGCPARQACWSQTRPPNHPPHDSQPPNRQLPTAARLLVLALVHGARVDLQVGLKALGRQLVGQDDVPGGAGQRRTGRRGR
jgi:hypothetical protein